MPEQFGDKTHPATPYRRQQAREQGHFAHSQDLVSAATLVGAFLILMWLGSRLYEYFFALTQQHLGGEAWLTVTPDFAAHQWHIVIVRLGQFVVPIFALFAVFAIIANLGQVGFLILPQKIGFDLNRLNVFQNASKIFSTSNVIRLGFGFFKIAIAAGVAFWSIWQERFAIQRLPEMELVPLAGFVAQTILWTCLKVSIALLILAFLDFAYQKWKYERELRMTDQELREEMRSLQGDPHIAMRRRDVQRQLTKSRIVTQIPGADLTLTSPTELAITIKYDPAQMEAPIMVAKGAGNQAQIITRLSREHRIPIRERTELAQFLYQHVEVSQAIPPAQFVAIAELLQNVYKSDQSPSAVETIT